MISQVDTDINIEPSQVRTFYEGRKIFITGGSGFIGNLLIQKLLRDCPDISTIYLLLRSKKDKSPEERLNEIFKNPVFDKLKKEQPNFGKKIKIIAGDIEKPNLDINESDRKLLEQEVDVIFHVAATVRFDEKLRRAVNINIRGTWDLINFAKNMSNLKVFLHVSTAYSHCPRKTIKEVIYDIPISPKRILQIVDTLNDEELETLTPKLIGKWPNTYVFTKAITEKVLEQYGKELPLVIVRPSMVISTYKDPVESWINNFNGPVGMSVAFGVGLVRVIFAQIDSKCDIVPGDILTNNMIVAASYVGNKLNECKRNNVIFDELITLSDIPIFNCVSGPENSITWRKFHDLAQELSFKWMTIHAIWYHCLIVCRNYKMFLVLQFLIETIPAYIVDIILICLQKKLRMTRIYNKINEYRAVVSYFANREWNFYNNNTQVLWNITNNTDKKIFLFSMKEVSWRTYFSMYGKGLRVYLLNDPLETLPQARAKYEKLKYAHYTLVTIFYLLSLYVFYQFVSLFI